jgi:xanthine dehydrogenase molybdopterin-binding subunit B
MWHACFVRSPLPRARIVGIDATEALALPGVHAVFTAADLNPDVVEAWYSVSGRDTPDTPRPPLAAGEARFAGDPVALVVAESRYVAEDATELVDVEYYGQVVPEGSAMLLLIGAANRDERRYEDPDRFDIHRDLGQHLTFGYGLHFCLGASLARLEGRVALDEVLKRFPEWEVDEDNIELTSTSTVRGWNSMPVRIP